MCECRATLKCITVILPDVVAPVNILQTCTFIEGTETYILHFCPYFYSFECRTAVESVGTDSDDTIANHRRY